MQTLTDTNLLLRFVDAAHPAYSVVYTAYENCRSQGQTLCIVPQNYYEFWVVATRPVENNGLGLTPKQTVEEFRRLEQGFTLLLDKPDLLAEWTQLVVDYDCKGKIAHDARLVAAMNTHGIDHLLTFNGADFRRFKHITVIDPADIQPLDEETS